MERKSSEDEMIIKLQTLDNCLTLKVRRSASVSELKQKINESYNIPVDKQRLIFQGKLLKDVDKLASNKISDDSVIHLVAKSVVDQPDIEPFAHDNTQSDPNIIESIPTNSAQQEFFPNLLQFPVIRANRPRRQRASNFDISECFESLHQNISSIENLKSCKNEFDEIKLEQTQTVIPFDFVKAKYEIGQWVDVKDTIDQWLEAQVIQVREYSAYVHYNGWGTRWDEWIEFTSPRIAPFRTFTVQSPSSIFSSPHPSVPCDANAQPQERSIDTYYYLEKCSKYMVELNKNIDNLINSRKISGNMGSISENREKEIKSMKDNIWNKNSQNNQVNERELNKNDLNILFQTSQIIPMLDRCGRLFSDVSLYLSHTILNPDLCKKLLLEQSKIKDKEENIIHETLNECLNSQVGLNNRSSFSSINNIIPNTNNTAENLDRPSSTPNSYNLSHSSSELPFIQTLQNSRGNTYSNSRNIDESWPKINLQVPAIFNSSGMSNSSFGGSNIDIYVHTVISGPNSNSRNGNMNLPNQRNVTNLNFPQNPQSGISNDEINLSNTLAIPQGLNTNIHSVIPESSNDDVIRIQSNSRIGLVNSFFQEKSTQTEITNQGNNQIDENGYFNQTNQYLENNLVGDNSNYEECEDDENINDLSNDNSDDIDNI